MTIDVQAVLTLLATLVVVVAGITAGVVWLRRWLRHQVAEPLATVRTEVEVNKGDSMHDAVNRIETKVDTLGTRFQDHLTYGHGPARDGR